MLTFDGSVTKDQSGYVVDGRHPPLKTPVGVLPWTCRSEGNDRADRLAGKATLTRGLLLGRYEVLRSLRHYRGSKTKDITPSIAWRREAETLPVGTKPRTSHHRPPGGEALKEEALGDHA